MTEKDLLTKYNYDSFIPDNFTPWMRFDESPSLGTKCPDFPLWKLEDQSETTLHEICSAHLYTIVEFGSFT